MDDVVLSWRLEDICNQDLYKNEVKEIPTEFQSIGKYLKSFTLPLIEETRAELFSVVETISEVPCAKIRHVTLDDTKHGLVCKMDILVNGFSGGTDLYEPKNGDVFVLSSLKPESIDDLFRYGVTYCLAIVKKVVEFELDAVVMKQFTMSMSPTITSEDQIQRCTYALYLTSTVTNSRIWKALQSSGVDQNLSLIKKALSKTQIKNKPPKGFYHLLVEETRGVYNHFVKTTFPSKGEYTYPSLEALFSYWKDGEAKLNLIIDTLISNEMNKEASDRNTEDAAASEERDIVAPTDVVQNEFKEREEQEYTLKELYWDELKAFQQRSYQKDDLKSITNLFLAAHSLLDEEKTLSSFDEHLVEEMKSVVCASVLDILARSDEPTWEDLYSKWPHGEIKLKLVVNTILVCHESKLVDGKEVSKNSDKGKLVEKKAVAKMDAGSSNQHKMDNQKTNKKSRKKGKKNRR